MKYFVTSDIHSFFDPFFKALKEAGFEENNSEHTLITLGDNLDRGSQSNEVLDYIMSLERVILIKGNHDVLLDDCCKRGYWYNADKSNGTLRTILDLSGIDITRFKMACDLTQDKLKEYKSKLINYYETEHYIFVHSWIPFINHYGEFSFNEDWRYASQKDWEEEAMWINPFLMGQKGLNKTGKTIVFGHWHTSAGWYYDDCRNRREFGEGSIWEPYINKEQGIIGIDRCTAYTGECNVIVLED